SGRDAVAFAQAQFMNDVAALAPGHWQWNGWLDPKGRVQALFQLLRIDEETLLAVTASPVDALAAALRRFLFRSKVAIDLPDLAVAGVLARAREAAEDRIASQGDVLELDLSSDAGERTLLLGANVPADTFSERDWSVLDLRHGWPGIPGAHLDAWTPQQLSLQRFPAFSVRKGCYPGQEIVARTHFLGRAKREAVLFEAVRGELPDGPLHGPEGATATPVARAGNCCLAVASCERPSGDWTSGDAVLVERPLAGGLSRPSASVS
ncbi:MAG TPA: folate-binding protein, partial [Lysobacter sp.]